MELLPLQPTRQDLAQPVDRKEPPTPHQANMSQEPVEAELQDRVELQELTSLPHTRASTEAEAEAEAEPEPFPTQEDTEPAD